MSTRRLTDFIRQAFGKSRTEAEEAWPKVFDEMRILARRLMANERPDHTLQPTALVSECYLRLRSLPDAEFADRAQFFALVGRLMRRILATHGQAKRAEKRGKGWRRVPFSEDLPVSRDSSVDDKIDLELALDRLAADFPSSFAVLREYFGRGRTFAAIARDLELSDREVRRRCTAGLAALFCLLEH